MNPQSLFLGLPRKRGLAPKVPRGACPLLLGRPGVLAVLFVAACSCAPIQSQARADEPLAVERVVLRDARGEPTTDFAIGEDVLVEVHYRARERIERPYFWLSVDGQHGPLFMANMLFDDRRPEAIEGEGTIACTFRAPPLLPQVYTITLGARAKEAWSALSKSSWEREGLRSWTFDVLPESIPTTLGGQRVLSYPALIDEERSVALRPAYMHNATQATLEEVVRHYEKEPADRPSRSPLFVPVALSEQERADLVAFMQTLDGGNGGEQAPKLPGVLSAAAADR